MSTYLFGQFLLDEGIIQADQLYAALQYQRQNNKVLGELAREEKVLTEQQVTEILEWQLCEDADFGEAAIAMGLLDKAGLDRLLALQEENHVLLGEALVAIGAVDKDVMDREFERYDSGREKVEAETQAIEEEDKENAPIKIWSIFTRVLPRFTGGQVVSGGFYSTIQFPTGGNLYIQGVGGDMKFELAVVVQNDVEELIRSSSGGKGSPNATQELLTTVLEVFCSAMEPSGVAVSPQGKPKKISGKELEKRKKDAASSSCVEFFLIQPPLLDGEFYQINGCLLFAS